MIALRSRSVRVLTRPKDVSPRLQRLRQRWVGMRQRRENCDRVARKGQGSVARGMKPGLARSLQHALTGFRSEGHEARRREILSAVAGRTWWRGTRSQASRDFLSMR